MLELATRRAWHLDQLVGPYSRYGFHHPGPAMFYLAAPFVRLLEPSGPGMYLASVAINGAAMVAIVAYVWRRLSPLCALVAAALVDLFAWAVSPEVLRYPWNPYLVVMAILLLVVLAAGAVAEATPGAWLWPAVIGSYCVQTHVSTLLYVVVVVAATGVYAVARAIRTGRWARGEEAWWRGGRWWRSPARGIGVVCLVLIWVPPVVELFAHSPNNLSAMWDFFNSTHATIPLSVARMAVAKAITVFPYGNQAVHNGQALFRPGWQLIAFDLGMVIVVVATVVVGWRRRNRFSLALTVAAVLGPIVGTFALIGGSNDLYSYLTLWLAFVPVAAVLALAVTLLTPPVRIGAHAPAPATETPTERRRPVGAVMWGGVAVAVISAGLLLQQGARLRPADQVVSQPNLNGQVMASTVMRMLSPSDRWVGFTVLTTDAWPDLASAVLTLDRRGINSTVAPDAMLLYFGRERAAGRPVAARFEVYQTNDPEAAAQARGRVVARTGIDVLTYVGP